MNFLFQKLRFKICFPGSSIKLAKTKEECEEFTTCLRNIFGAACSFVGFFIILRQMMTVMAVSFALPPHFFETLWIAKNGKFIKL